MTIFFRRRLRSELDAWRAENLVDDEQAQKLVERYKLDSLESEAQSTLMSTIFLVAVVLIGCGVVTFVAAHWDKMGRGVKVALLLLAMLAAHGAGYWLWRVRKPARPHLGHSLTVLGTLIFGASIMLFGQIFHISGRLDDAFLAWGAGAGVMAWALLSVPNAVVAAAASFIGFCIYMSMEIDAFWAYPFLAGA